MSPREQSSRLPQPHEYVIQLRNFTSVAAPSLKEKLLRELEFTSHINLI